MGRRPQGRSQQLWKNNKIISEKVAMRNMNQLQDGFQIRVV
jgi:hypothetical protein